MVKRKSIASAIPRPSRNLLVVPLVTQIRDGSRPKSRKFSWLWEAAQTVLSWMQTGHIPHSGLKKGSFRRGKNCFNDWNTAMQKVTGTHCIIFPRAILMQMSYDTGQIVGSSEAVRQSGVGPGRCRSMATQVVKQRKPYKNIATWNVRTMQRYSKMADLTREMDAHQISVMGISETRWKDPGEFTYNKYLCIHSGNKQGQGGVAILLDKEAQMALLDAQVINHRMMEVTLREDKMLTKVIQVYMPTSSHEEAEVDEMYEILSERMRMSKRHDNVIIMGDFNAIVGEQVERDICGRYGLGERNERGEKLVEFCHQEELVITNTFYKVQKRRRYTWKSPDGIHRNQIDYILVRKRFRNQVKKSSAYPGADIDSDHNLVMMRTSIRLKKKLKGQKRKKWNIGKLKNLEIKQQYQREIRKNLLQGDKDEKQTNAETNVETKWQMIKTAVKEAAESVIGTCEVIPKQEWMTEEILNKMKERAKWKNSTTEEGKQKWRRLRNEVNRECIKARNKWLDEKCENIENLQQCGKTEMAHKEVKRMMCNNKSSIQTRALKDGKGNILTDPDDKKLRWMEYVKVLYKADSGTIPLPTPKEEKCISLEILRHEFEEALRQLAKNKATGIDEIPAELLTNGGTVIHDKLFELVKDIYDSGEWPSDYTRNIIVPIPKVPGTNDCEKHRTISLISHASKILLRIIKRRIEKKVEDRLTNSQFGFRKNCGTRDAIGVLRFLAERLIELGRPLYVAYIDYEKAFDTVPWEQLFDLLSTLDVDSQTTRLIYHLYENQEAVIALQEGQTEPVKIRIGTRQGCLLSPDLFNAYSEQMMLEAIGDLTVGVRVGGKIVNEIKYADDQAIIAGSARSLQTLVTRIAKTARKYGMRINATKTKVMVIGIRKTENIEIKINNQLLEQVTVFKYLGQMISNDGKCGKEIRTRLAMAKSAFAKHQRTLTSSKISLRIRKRLLKTYVWSIALYGAETWTVGRQEQKKLDAFEQWGYRRMLGISWRDRRTNISVLREVGETKNFYNTIRQRRLEWIGHVLRHDGLLRDVMEGRIEGKRRRGRPRQTFIMQVLGDVGVDNYGILKRMADCREQWRDICKR